MWLFTATKVLRIAAAGAFGNASQGSGLAWGRGQRAESCSNILLFALGASLSVVESLDPPFFLLNQLCSPLRTSVNQHAGDVAFDVRQQIATGQVLPQVAGSALCARTVLSQVDDCFAVVENRYDGSDDGGEFDRPAQDPYIPPPVRKCSVIAGKRPYVVCQVLRYDAVQPLRVVKVRGSPRSGAQQVACEASISAA